MTRVKPRSRTLKGGDWLRKEIAWAKAHPHSIKTTRYRIVTPTLRRLERAAMRWWRWMETKGYFVGNPFHRVTELGDACAADAQISGWGKEEETWIS